MADVIKNLGQGENLIVWKYNKDNIKWGSQLIVREWEVATFLRDGKLFDVFGPGRFILTSQNLPLLTRAYNFLAGYNETPFKADIIFVSKKMFNGSWGIQTMVKATKDMDAPMTLKAHGNYQFRIENPTIFITQVLGGLDRYSTNEVNIFLKGFFNEKLIQELSKYTYMDVWGNLEETSTKTMVNIADIFNQRGIEIVTLKIAGIDTDEKFKEDLYNFQRFRTETGRDYRQFEVMEKMAESIGKSRGGAAVGTGMLLFPQMYQDLGKQKTKVMCPHCNAQVDSNIKFCSNCGKELKIITKSINEKETSNDKTTSGNFKICPYCGKDLNLPKTPKFCPYCKEQLK